MTDDLVEWLRETEDHLYGATRCCEAADRIERLEKALRYIAEIKGEIAEEPPEEIGEETHKMWISLILCAVSAEAALEKKDE